MAHDHDSAGWSSAYLPSLALLAGWLASSACSADTYPIEGPSEEELFVVKSGTCDPNEAPNGVTVCTRKYFDETVLKDWCVVPDADSFDDYEQFREDDQGTVLIDPTTERPVVEIARGVTPAAGAQKCKPDGIVTGPANETYYPSRFCRVPDCRVNTID